MSAQFCSFKASASIIYKFKNKQISAKWGVILNYGFCYIGSIDMWIHLGRVVRSCIYPSKISSRCKTYDKGRQVLHPMSLDKPWPPTCQDKPFLKHIIRQKLI